MRRFLIYPTASLILIVFTTLAYAVDPVGELKVGDPTKDGDVELKVTIPGIDQIDNKPLIVKILAADTAEGKAFKIRDAIKAKYGNEPVASVLEATPTTITVSYKRQPGTVAKISDATSEDLRASLDSLPSRGKSLDGVLSYEGSLSGIDANGNIATYLASFGFDGLNASAELSFDTLSAPTIDGLLTDLFGQLLADLPIDFKSDLSLDLASRQIVFAFLLDRTNYFVENSTTDTDLQRLGGLLMTVPQPPSLLMFGLSVVGFFLVRRRRH